VKSGVRFIELVRPTKTLKAQEAALNREIAERFPEAGPVRLVRTADGELGVKMSFTMAAGKKSRYDALYRFVMQQLGKPRGRKPEEKRIQVKYRVPEELHRRIQQEASKAHVSASDLVSACLKKEFGEDRPRARRRPVLPPLRGSLGAATSE
jgi:hypothetical protein